MSEEKNRKRNASSAGDQNTRKRRSICQDVEEDKKSCSAITAGLENNGILSEKKEMTIDTNTESDAKQKSQAHDTAENYNSKHRPLTSVSDSVFSEGSVLKSVSQLDKEDSDDDPLEEYETQYFGFTPKSFMNGVYNALAEYIRESLAALTEYIKSQYPNDMTSSQLQEGEEYMMKYVLKKLNRSFDILEQYLMTNVFKIPDQVVLPEDKIQEDNQYTEDDEKKIDLEIKQLEDKILTIRYANGVLRQDLTEMDEVQTTFEKSLKQLDTLEEITSNCGVSDIKDSTLYAINQLTKMIKVVQNLENTDT